MFVKQFFLTLTTRPTTTTDMSFLATILKTSKNKKKKKLYKSLPKVMYYINHSYLENVEIRTHDSQFWAHPVCYISQHIIFCDSPLAN